MACYDGSKRSLEEDSFTAGTELSSCALAMMARERESLPSPSESPGAFSNSVSNTSSSLQTAELTQGYDVEFDPPLERKYECPICLMALRNAIQTPCGHRFCKNCIKKSIRDTGQRCPVDNAMLLEDQLFLDNFANREILSLTVRCPNTGCINKMELRQLENHLKQCEFATAECPQCQHSVMKSDLENHKTLECLRRPVSCPDCVACFVYEEKELHEQQCPFANVKCQYCDLDLIRDQMESHCETDCPKAPIMCNFSDFGCKERMQRHDLAQHMQEFTQMHMRYIADFLSGLNLSSTAPRSLRALGSSLSCEDQGAASVPAFRQSISCNSNCAVGQQSQEMLRIREMDARLVKQDHQLRELIIVKDNQAGQLAELQRKVSALEETVKELEAQQCHGVFIWPLKSFSALLRNQEAGHPVVEHSPGFYTGHPGYKLCLRLHLQTPNAPRCSNFISLFVHTMQGAFDGLLTWPFQGTIRLAILDQGPEGQHHMEVMETNPELQAFRKPTMYRNNKGFGYVTFLNLHQLSQRAFVKDDTLLIRCEVTPRFDNMFHREGPAMQPRGPEVKPLNFELPN